VKKTCIYIKKKKGRERLCLRVVLFVVTLWGGFGSSEKGQGKKDMVFGFLPKR
jgi:hypothetical protein